MPTIQITLKGIAAELTLGSYMPKDATIFNNWEDFYHFNDLIHVSQLLAEHISEIEIKQDAEVIFKGKIPASQFKAQKSFSPALKDSTLYLRTECAEQAVYQCEFETEQFDKMKLMFETQDYDLLFKVGSSFLSKVTYDAKELNPEWVSGKPVGNICLLCRAENGYLMPVYDAVRKIAVGSKQQAVSSKFIALEIGNSNLKINIMPPQAPKEDVKSGLRSHTQLIYETQNTRRK